MEFLKNKNLSPLNFIPFNFSFYKNNQTADESPPLFKTGVINDRFAIFSEYRNSFQNRFFHFFLMIIILKKKRENFYYLQQILN